MTLKPELIPQVVARFAALADESRLRILMRLRQSPCNVTTLAGELGAAQASVSKHLSVLRQAGLVDVERQGTQAIYRIDDGSVFDMCQIVCDGVVRHLRSQMAAAGLAPAGPGTGARREGNHGRRSATRSTRRSVVRTRKGA